MADTRESVVLAQDGTVGPSPVSMVARKAVSTPPTLLDLRPCLLRTPTARRSLDFLVAQLGIGVDLLGKGPPARREAVHGLRNGIFDGTHRGLRGVRFQIRSTDYSPKHSFVERR